MNHVGDSGSISVGYNAQGQGTPDTRRTPSGFEPSGSPCKSSSPVLCYSKSVDESVESKETDSMSVASPVLGMRAMAAPMILQESSTYGKNGDAFLVQGWDRTQPLTVDRNRASQGLLFPIEATKSKVNPNPDRMRRRMRNPQNLRRMRNLLVMTARMTNPRMTNPTPDLTLHLTLSHHDDNWNWNPNRRTTPPTLVHLQAGTCSSPTNIATSGN